MFYLHLHPITVRYQYSWLNCPMFHGLEFKIIFTFVVYCFQLSDGVRSEMLRCAISRLYCLDLAAGYNPVSDCITFSDCLDVRGTDVPQDSVCYLVLRLGRSLNRLQFDATELSLVAAAATVRPLNNPPGKYSALIAICINVYIQATRPKVSAYICERVKNGLERLVNTRCHRWRATLLLH